MEEVKEKSENEQSKSLKIGVIGSGAVGCVIASVLSAKGMDVEYVYGHHQGIIIDEQEEISVIKPSGNISALVKCVSSVNEFSGPKDIIFLVCKSTLMDGYAYDAKAYLKEGGIVVVLNNTLVRHSVTTNFPLSQIVGMFILWSCDKISDTKVKITNSGPTVFGVYDNAARPLAEMVVRIFGEVSECVLEERFNDFVLGRVICNAAISGLGAISGCKLGGCLSNKYGRKLLEAMIKEGCLAYNSIGISPKDYDGKLNYNLYCSDTWQGKLYRHRITQAMLKYNADMVSSILQDLLQSKPTEVEYLLGKIVKTAKKSGTNCHFTEKVYQKILEIESGNDTISFDNMENIFKESKLQ